MQKPVTPILSLETAWWAMSQSTVALTSATISASLRKALRAVPSAVISSVTRWKRSGATAAYPAWASRSAMLWVNSATPLAGWAMTTAGKGALKPALLDGTLA